MSVALVEDLICEISQAGYSYLWRLEKNVDEFRNSQKLIALGVFLVKCNNLGFCFNSQLAELVKVLHVRRLSKHAL